MREVKKVTDFSVKIWLILFSDTSVLLLYLSPPKKVTDFFFSKNLSYFIFADTSVSHLPLMPLEHLLF